MIKRFFFALAIAFAAAHALAADERVALPGGATLILPIPDGWKHSRTSDTVPTLTLTPAKGDAFHIQVSVLVRPDGSLAATDPESFRRFVDNAADGVLPQSVEKTLPIQTLRGGNIRGQYFSSTDRAEPKPGEFKHMTQGVVAIQGLPVSFTILSNGKGQEAVQTAFEMFKAARRE